MPLSHIFHLSDLHIRNGDNNYSRYEEYSQVFKETIISIKSNIQSLKLSFEDLSSIILLSLFANSLLLYFNPFIFANYIIILANYFSSIFFVKYFYVFYIFLFGLFLYFSFLPIRIYFS